VGSFGKNIGLVADTFNRYGETLPWFSGHRAQKSRHIKRSVRLDSDTHTEVVNDGVGSNLEACDQHYGVREDQILDRTSLSWAAASCWDPSKSFEEG
jgi:hypothetical protein